MRKFIIVAMLFIYYDGVFNNVRAFYYNTPIGKSSERGLFREEVKLRGMKIFSIIPKEDYNSIYSYGSGILLQEYIRNGVYPIGKYFAFHHIHYLIDEKVQKEMDAFHLTSDAKWIVSDLVVDALSDCTFKTMLNKYELVYSESGVNLYERNY